MDRAAKLSIDALLAVSLIHAALCRAKPIPPIPFEAEITAAVKSPETLARYVESHDSIDWKTLRKTVGLQESERWLAPCGSNFPAGESPCSAELVSVLDPAQTIVIIRGGRFSYTVEYLRFLRDTKGTWTFSGENNVFQRNSPSHHKVTRLGKKPFLMISSDHSQNGVATQQVLEDWFDLTQPDFEPALSVTVVGSQSRRSFGVGREFHATLNLSESGDIETADLLLDIHFNGVGLDQQAYYVGVYERQPSEKKFSLRNAYSDRGRRTPMPTIDFGELADPFSGLSNEKLLAYALPGLQKIASGSDLNAKEWLRSVLDNAGDTREKRLLLELLTKR